MPILIVSIRDTYKGMLNLKGKFLKSTDLRIKYKYNVAALLYPPNQVETARVEVHLMVRIQTQFYKWKME